MQLLNAKGNGNPMAAIMETNAHIGHISELLHIHFINVGLNTEALKNKSDAKVVTVNYSHKVPEFCEPITGLFYI